MGDVIVIDVRPPAEYTAGHIVGARSIPIDRLASKGVGELWRAMRDVAAVHHAELEGLAAAYLGHRAALDEVSRVELTQRIAMGDVIVIDVRPPAEYTAGHIVGARSIPIDRLAREMRSLPTEVEVVAYCRGPYCVLADEAVRLLRKRGRIARRLVDGFPEWRHARLPIQTEVASFRQAFVRRTAPRP